MLSSSSEAVAAAVVVPVSKAVVMAMVALTEFQCSIYILDKEQSIFLSVLLFIRSLIEWCVIYYLHTNINIL